MNNSTSVMIKEAKSNKGRIFKDFFQLPYKLYKDNPYWVPQLMIEEKKNFDPVHNPFLKKNPVVFYVCYKDGCPVGRIAGIINKAHNEFHKDKAAFFGFFESIDDGDVARALFEAVIEWAKKQGSDSLRGPTSYSINDVAGLLLNGFDESPFLLMPYNPAYYERLYRQEGFEIIIRFFSYEVTEESIRFPNFVEKMENRLKDNDITLRYARFNDEINEAKIVLDIFNNSWDENWGFVPFSYEEALSEFSRLKSFAKHDLILIAEHKNQPVGFMLAMPDINQVIKPLKGRLLPFNWIKLIRNLKNITQIRVVLMGILKDYRNKGIDLLFYKKIVENSLKYNYRKAELSWILENNVMMNRVLEHINARKNKIYAIFEKKI